MNSSKKTLYLFTDGSVNPQTKIGFASYLLLDSLDNTTIPSDNIHTKQFNDTSSTKLELEALLWALNNLETTTSLITVYTDCQNILSLLKRQERLELSNYQTKKGTPLANEKLYRAFFEKLKHQSCQFIKVKGHKQKHLRDTVDIIFSLVDKKSREALRRFQNNQT